MDYRLGEWTIRPQRGCIERGGESIRLKPKSMAVLECLAQAGDQVVTRDDLFDAVWPRAEVSDATLTQCIAELRRALGDSAQDPQYIKTVPKIGFCLMLPVEELPDGNGGATGLDNTRHWTLLKRQNRFAAGFTLVVTIAALIFGVSRYRQSAEQGAGDPALAEPYKASVAVLPFDSLSDEPGSEYFAEGLSEEIRNLLSKIPELNVTAQASSSYFRNRELSSAEIGRALNVTHLLGGSVRKSDDRIRITTHLVKAETGFDIWSERYDRSFEDVFAVQDEIAAAVADALRINLVGGILNRQQTDVGAYSLYLQALYFFNQATPGGRSDAITKLEEALAVDAEYAPALALLAAIYLYQSNYGERPFNEGFELGRRTAVNSLALDTRLGKAWGTLAYIQSFYDWDWPAAGRSIEKMLETVADDAIAKNHVATYNQMLGQFERSLEFREEAIRMDPLSPYFRESKAFTLLSLGRLEDADVTLQELLDLFPEFHNAQLLRAKVKLLGGDNESALQTLESLPPGRAREKMLHALALNGVGRLAEAEAELSAISSGSDSGSSYYLALYYAWVGETEPAFEHLEQAVEERFRVLAYVLGEPLLYPLHGDSRWQKVIERIDLLRYWLQVPKKYGGPAD